MALSEELKSDNPPSLLIYAMIPHHINRNYIRKRWVNILSKKNDRYHPHFEIINGNLEFQSVVCNVNGKQNMRKLRAKELELTVAFLINMQKKCKQRKIPFITILLPQPHRHSAWPPFIIASLVEHNILFLDLSEMKIKGMKGKSEQGKIEPSWEYH